MLQALRANVKKKEKKGGQKPFLEGASRANSTSTILSFPSFFFLIFCFEKESADEWRGRRRHTSDEKKKIDTKEYNKIKMGSSVGFHGEDPHMWMNNKRERSCGPSPVHDSSDNMFFLFCGYVCIISFFYYFRLSSHNQSCVVSGAFHSCSNCYLPQRHT